MKLFFVAERGSRSRRPLPATVFAGALATALWAGTAAPDPVAREPAIPQRAREHAGNAPTLRATLASNERARHTIVLRDAPLASYDGRLAGFPAPPRKAAGARPGRVDVTSVQARAWLGQLERRQRTFVTEASAQLGRPLGVTAQLRHALNAVIVDLTDAEATAIAARDDVRLVERDQPLELLTDRGPAFIGAPPLWDGSATGGAATKGEGIVIALLDSGINWKSPAFTAVGPVDGYTHVNPLGPDNYLGLCGPTPPNADIGRCNDKLIGMYNFVSILDTRSATDDDGHGSHTASTAAGNTWDASFGGGTFRISGVAPHANLIAYKVCTGTCPNSAVTQAANQAVADGIVDVISFSVSGGTSPWTDVTSLAFLGAHDAGIFVATSAGNGGPGGGSAEHQEPWVQTAGAVAHDRLLGFNLSAIGAVTPPPETQNIALRPGKPPVQAVSLYGVPVIQSPGFANGATDGCTAAGAFAPGTFTRPYAPPADGVFADSFDPPVQRPPVSGVAVLNFDPNVQGCGTSERRDNAVNAGAAGVIFVDRGYLNLATTGNTWSMRRSDWDALAALDPATATVSIERPARSYARTGDVIPPFSARGPRPLANGQWLVKPDIVAPGVDVLAAWQAHAGPTEDTTATALDNGTSMAAPHVAGAAALLRALNPTWTPTQIKSALMLTAKVPGVVTSNGQPGTTWDRGAGRVDLAAAAKAGLILDESGANFLAANPATGGNASSLNLPSLASGVCVGTCTYTRTLRRALVGAQTYTATVEGFANGVVDVSPASFTLGSSAERTLTITLHSNLLPSMQWALGEVVLTPASPAEPVLRLPVAIRPAGPAIQVTPAAITASGGASAVVPVTVRNIGNPTLEWAFVTSGTVQVTPLNTATTGNGQQAGYYNGAAKGYYWAQNFDVTARTRMTTLRANGFTLPGTSMNTGNTPAVTFSVYADANGAPAGAPEGFGAPPSWTYSNTIGAANGISATSGTLSLNLSAAPVAANPLDLAPGRYWLMVWPTLNGLGNVTPGNPIWAWRNSADPQIGAIPHLYAPSDDPINWRTDPAVKTLAAFVQGTVDCATPAWLTYSAAGGTLGYASETVVDATLNAAGLADGTYYAALCVGSNATNKPTVIVPVRFDVQNGG